MIGSVQLRAALLAMPDIEEPCSSKRTFVRRRGWRELIADHFATTLPELYVTMCTNR